MSGNAQRILFRTSARRGLGHLVRGLNIARQIRRRDPSVEIGLAARAESTDGMIEAGLVDWVRTSTNDAEWPATLRAFDPSLTVYDTVLPGPAPEPWASRPAVFVMRRCRDERQRALLSDPLLRRFDRLLIPHEEWEFGFSIPPDLGPRTRFVGPIVRLPRPELKPALRERYAFDEGDFVLVTTAGGGGFTAHTRELLAASTQAHRRLRKEIPRLRHVVVTGPRFVGPVDAAEGMTVVESEPELATLLGLADCVVAAGGYNTIHEIRANRVPAILIPGHRTHDDQHERVAALAEAGVALVLEGSVRRQARRIVEVCRCPEALEAMRRAYDEHVLRPGNDAAAEEILRVLSC